MDIDSLQLGMMRHISEHGPRLSLIDEDCGQLNALMEGEEHYPVTFPCCLVGDLTIKWTTVAPFSQLGEGTIRVKVSFDCYDDTHIGSGTEEKVKERLKLDNAVYKVLQGQKIAGASGRLSRRDSTDYNLPGGIKVYETIWRGG